MSLPKTFTSGERLFAADLNDNFDYLDDLTRVTENVQSSNYTLALTDFGKVVAMNNSSAATVTVPTNASVAFPIGSVVNVYAMTDEEVTIDGDLGVTVRNAGVIEEQYTEVSLRKRETNEWVLVGTVGDLP